MRQEYEMVIGLEVHVELKTATKIFCSCPTTFGAEPNTQCCPVCMGMPGTLPVLNEQVVEYAIKAGLALNCTIASYSKQDRKNYFYPDLPKAYQISEYDLPLCEHGYLDVEAEAGTRRICITRIHIEEDAGKLIHDEQKGTLLDCNRCGVPLIEIVSEPDIRSSQEAKAYVQKLRSILLYTGVSDCKMNEGSLRCDVNLSVRKKGAKELGTRTEMKNLNSFQFIQKAIEYEFGRQVEALEKGEAIVQETRRFDQATGKTYSMRSKEDAEDYRYFPDPDLLPIRVLPSRLQTIQASIPILPDQRKKEYVQRYAISAHDAELLAADRAIADYFEMAAAKTQYPKLLANLILSEIARQTEREDIRIPIDPEHMAKLAQLFGDGRINSGTAKRIVQMLWEDDRDPEALVAEEGLEQIQDPAILLAAAQEVIGENEKIVRDFVGGKKAAFQALVGQTMKKTKGKGDPAQIQAILRELLDKK